MIGAFVEMLTFADWNFVSIGIIWRNDSVVAIAGKGRVTAIAARPEAGLSAVVQRTRDRRCRVVPQHVVLQSRRITTAVLGAAMQGLWADAGRGWCSRTWPGLNLCAVAYLLVPIAACVIGV